MAHVRSVTASLAAISFALALAACGSSGKSGSVSTKAAAGIEFADCMRSHGLPGFPDPSAGGGIRLPDGINPQSPAFQSAQRACTKYMPGAGGRPQASEQRKLEMLKLASCMRHHGLPSFPDPTSRPPAGGPGSGSGIGLAFGAPGSFIAVPQTLLQSPAFRTAAATCGFPGGRGGGAKKSFNPG
jgi:hypothetical protein